MTPHPWRIQRLLAYLLPSLLVVCLWAWALAGYRALSAERIFADDAVYRHLTISESIAQRGVYGLDTDQPLPLISDVGWEVALAAAQGIGVRPVVALQVLAMFSAFMVLLLILKLAHQLHPHPLYGYAAAIGLALSAGYLLPAVNGQASSLLMCLLTAAVVRHLHDLATRGVGVPALSVVLIGLAMWIRLESIVVLLLLWVHALSLSGVGADPRPPLLNGVLRGVNALLVVSLMMLPWVVWNLKQLSVPIPRMLGVPRTADIWALEGAAAGWRASVALLPLGWSESWSAFRQFALPESAVARLLWVIGWLALVWQSVKIREDRPYFLLALVPVLLPLLLAVLYPYLGSEGFAVVMQSVLPLMWLIIAYGWTRLPTLVETVLVPQGVPQAKLRVGAWIWWILMGVIVLLSMTASLQRAQRGERLRITNMAEAREEVAAWLAASSARSHLVITDQPGWLHGQPGVSVRDLNGRWTPELIRMVGDQGRYERDQVLRYLHPVAGSAHVWILMSTEFDDWQAHLPGAHVVMDRYPLEPHRPLILKQNGSAAF